MHKIISGVAKTIKHFLNPPYCQHCRCFMQYEALFCVSCTALIHPVVSLPLPIRKSVTMPVFAISMYHGPIKTLILAKTRFNMLASRQLACLLWQQTPICYQPFDLIVPIPLHWTRYAYRGYNQAAVIAHELSKISGKPMIELLSRQRRTALQSSLDAQGRIENLTDAFCLVKNSQAYQNKRILVVDDLMTTGATLKQAASTLLQLKPKALLAAVGART